MGNMRVKFKEPKPAQDHMIQLMIRFPYLMADAEEYAIAPFLQCIIVTFGQVQHAHSRRPFVVCEAAWGRNDAIQTVVLQHPNGNIRLIKLHPPRAHPLRVGDLLRRHQATAPARWSQRHGVPPLPPPVERPVQSGAVSRRSLGGFRAQAICLRAASSWPSWPRRHASERRGASAPDADASSAASNGIFTAATASASASGGGFSRAICRPGWIRLSICSCWVRCTVLRCERLPPAACCSGCRARPAGVF